MPALISVGTNTYYIGDRQMAQRQELRDFSGRLLGWLERSCGRLEARDYSGRLRGWHDERANETRDYTGRRVGQGNLLAALITAP